MNTPTYTVESPRSISFVWSYMNLLSGGLDDCQHADDETCSAGIASVHAFLRQYSNGVDEGSLIISRIDYQSVFVNMHPLDWGVNRLILHDRFDHNIFFAYRSLLSSTKDNTNIQQRNLSTLQTEDLQVLLGNVVVATSNVWSQYTKNIYFDEDTGLAVIVVDNGEAGEGDTLSLGTLNSVSQIQAVRGLLSFVAQENQARGCSDTQNAYNLYLQTRHNGTLADPEDSEGTTDQICWIPIVVYDETREEFFQDFVNGMLAADKNPYPPSVIAQVRSYGLEYQTPQQLGPHGTWVVSFRSRSSNLAQVRLELSSDRRVVTNVTLIEQDLSTIPEEIKDYQFRDDIAYLRTLADEAKENNPIQGKSLAMPPAKFPDDIRYSPCMGGECPIGNLFTDALRWWTGADFAFVNSGGIRGPGWPEGPVRVGNIWEALPFANTQCTGTISGINIFRIFRESTAAATFLGTWTSAGDRLFQVSGIRYTYNTELEAPRLIALEIWDDVRKSYKPVERLQLYRFATGSWMCSGFDPFPNMLRDELKVEGEKSATIGDTLLQNIVGDYLGSLEEPYDTSVKGRLLNDTSATELLDFIQTEDSCDSSTYWVEEFLTCFDCPNTDEVVVTGGPEAALFEMENGSDDILSSRAELVNGEVFPVTVALKSKPEWLSFQSTDIWKDGEGQKITIAPGDTYEFGYDVSAYNLQLQPGLVSGPISFAVIDGGNYPGCVGSDAIYQVSLKILNEPQLIQPGSIMIVGFTLMSTILCLAIALAVWVYRNKQKRAVSSMQPYFLVALCFGVSVIGLSILPLSIRGLDHVSPGGQNMACMATPWLLSMGFAIVMSALFSKLWRINKIFSGRRFQRITVSSREALVAFGTVLSTNLLLMLLWTLIDPLEFDIRFVEDEEWKMYSTCSSQDGHSWIFLILTISINFFAMSLAIYEAYKARNISDDYSESKSLGIAIFSWIQILLVGCPVLFLIDEDNVAPKYFLQVVLIFVCCMSMLLIIFVPLVLKTWSKPSAGNRQRTSMRISGLNFSCFDEGGILNPFSADRSRSSPSNLTPPTVSGGMEKSESAEANPAVMKLGATNSNSSTNEVSAANTKLSNNSGRGNTIINTSSSSAERSIGTIELVSPEHRALGDHEAACVARLSMADSSEMTIQA
jgi:hypothetical protein